MNVFKRIKIGLNKIIIYIIVIFFFYFMIEDSLGIVIPLFFEEKKINIIVYGTLLAVTRVMRAILVLPISRLSLSRKFSALKLIIAADIIILLGFTNASAPIIIFVGFSILIITTSVINVILNPVLGIQAEDQIGIIFGIRDTFLYIGCFLGLLIIGKIKDLSNNTNFIWIFYCCIFVLIFIAIQKLEEEIKVGDLNDVLKENEVKEKNKGMSKSLIYYSIVVFILGIGGAYASYLPLIAVQIGIKENSIFYIFSSATVFSAILAISGGIAIDRFNKKHLFQFDIIVLIVILILYSTNSKMVFIAAIILSGLATAFDNVLNAYVFVNFSEEEVNRFWGVIGSVNLISFSLGTFLGGLIYQYNYHILFIFGIALNMLGPVLSTRLKNIEKNKEESNNV